LTGRRIARSGLQDDAADKFVTGKSEEEQKALRLTQW
jgi:hypothetical protein